MYRRVAAVLFLSGASVVCLGVVLHLSVTSVVLNLLWKSVAQMAEKEQNEDQE